MLRKIIIQSVAGVFLFPLIAFAQTDSSYIGFYDQRIALRTYYSKNFLILTHEAKKNEVSFLPNNPSNIGLGLSINNTVISFGYGYGFDFLRDKAKGKTKSLDFQIHNYGRKYVLDLFIQEYKGFYQEKNLGKKNEEIILHPDLKIRSYGLHGQYIFNNQKFSYKAAFDQGEKQLKSAGSFLLGGGIYLTKISSDSSFYYKDKYVFRNFQFGVSGGYSYTWVLGRHWFVNGSFTAGINLGCEKFSRIGKDRLEINPTALPRLSAGYNRKNWSLGFNALANVLFNSVTDDENINWVSGYAQLTYIIRFNYPKKK